MNNDFMTLLHQSSISYFTVIDAAMQCSIDKWKYIVKYGEPSKVQDRSYSNCALCAMDNLIIGMSHMAGCPTCLFGMENPSFRNCNFPQFNRYRSTSSDDKRQEALFVLNFILNIRGNLLDGKYV